MPADQETVLIFRLGSLGDTIVVLPCFHAAARRFPRARRVVLTNAPVSVKAPSIAAILGPSGLVDDFVDFKSPLGFDHGTALAREIRALAPTTLIFMAARPSRPSFWRDRAFFRACGIRKVIGGAPWRRLTPNVYPGTGEVEPEAEFVARSLAELGPIDLADRTFWDLRLTHAEKEVAGRVVAPLSRGFLAVNAGGKAVQKNWGSDNWRRFLGGVSRLFPDLGLLLVGSEDERDLCASLAGPWIGPRVNSAGLLAPRETAAALAKARAFVGHDSGPMHLAAAMGVRCIGLFGSYNRPRRWHPYGSGHRVFHAMEGIAAISGEAVLAAATEMLTAPVASGPVRV